MFELKREELRKNRGYGSLISVALSMLSRNFKQIAKHMWAFALAYSLVTAYAVIRSVHFARTDVLADAGGWTETGIVSVLLILTGIAFYGRATMLLNGRTMMYNLMRALKLFVFGVIVAVVIGAVVTGLSWLTFVILHKTGHDFDYMQTISIIYLILLCVLLVSAFALLPYAYVMMKYIMEPETRLRKLLFVGYKAGGRHYGYIFITMLLLSIIVTVVSAIISIPMMVLIIALGMSVGGAVVMGDPLGLPGYFYPMMYAVTVITYLIMSVLSLYEIFVVYYMYGSIEKRTEEKAMIARL